jgi:hypothetical protein
MLQMSIASIDQVTMRSLAGRLTYPVPLIACLDDRRVSERHPRAQTTRASVSCLPLNAALIAMESADHDGRRCV